MLYEKQKSLEPWTWSAKWNLSYTCLSVWAQGGSDDWSNTPFFSFSPFLVQVNYLIWQVHVHVPCVEIIDNRKYHIWIECLFWRRKEIIIILTLTRVKSQRVANKSGDVCLKYICACTCTLMHESSNWTLRLIPLNFDRPRNCFDYIYHDHALK